MSKSSFSLITNAIIDLVVSPINLITLVTGFTLFSFNLVFFNLYLSIIAFLLIMFSFGSIATKFALNFNEIIDKAADKKIEQEDLQSKIDLKSKYNILLTKISNIDEEGKSVIENYWDLYEILIQDINVSKLEQSIKDSVENAANESVISFMEISNSYIRLIEKINKIKRKRDKESMSLKRQFNDRKEEIFQNLSNFLAEFRKLVDEFHQMDVNSSNVNLERTKKELTDELEIAKKVSQQLSQLDQDFITEREMQ